MAHNSVFVEQVLSSMAFESRIRWSLSREWESLDIQMSTDVRCWGVFGGYDVWVLLLMAEILHHLGCMKPYK